MNMAQMITWDTCMYSLANQHFTASYVCIWLAVIAAVFLLSYYLFQVLYEKTALKERVTKERAEQLCHLFIQGATIFLVLFLLYFFIIFKADAVQVQVENITMRMGMGEIPIVERFV